MIAKISRRDLLHAGCFTAGALGTATLSETLSAAVPPAETRLRPERRNEPANEVPLPEPTVELFYKDDWLGAPWIKPEPALLIHGNDESSVAWFGWVPRMATEFRLIRPDLPGFGQSAIPRGFEWTMASLAAMMARFLDSIGVESAHIIGAKTGGAIGMQFAADYPHRTRTLTVMSAPVTPVSRNIAFHAPSATSQRKRLGSAASKELVDYWNNLMSSTREETRAGIDKVEVALNMESVLSRIKTPTLVITADQGALQPVETVVRYQQKIANSRLLVIPSDGYHVAVVRPEECVTNTVTFIRDVQRQGRAAG